MLIAIGGPSNAGKSDLAHKISNRLGKESNPVLCQDDYVFPEDKLPRIQDHIDWEHPDTIDNSAFLNKIKKALLSNSNVIVEGFMIYHWPEMNSLFDRKIFIQLDENTYRERKGKDQRWGLEPDWYIHHIWARYLEYGLAPEDEEVLFLDGSQPWPMSQILKFLNIK